MFSMSSSPFPTIDCDEARALLAGGAQLVDVRTPQEHAQGAIPGSFNLPLQLIHQAPEHLDRERPVIVYCRSGARSGQAQTMLRSMGFDAVHNFGAASKYLNC
jgi:phage shock protein E